MSDRPIIFSGPMVRAILEGRKTQTRRVLKPQPDNSLPIGGADFVAMGNDPGRWCWLNGFDGSIISPFLVPYHPGDRLWVREAWRTLQMDDYIAPRRLAGDRSKVTYEADPENRNPLWAFGRSRSPMHMPRWASRLTLIVEDVRVQRVQDISDKDAEAEGLSTVTKDGKHWKWGIADSDGLPGNDDGGWHWQDWNASPVETYARLWNSLNAKRGYGWDANPWVVALTFNPIKKNIDEVKDDE